MLPRPPPEYFLGMPKLLVLVDPKPADLELMPNPPLLRSSEDTPVYLDAFVLACSGVLCFSGAAFLNVAAYENAQQHRDARTADVVVLEGAWSHGCQRSSSPHGERMGHDSSSTPWLALSARALCL